MTVRDVEKCYFQRTRDEKRVGRDWPEFLARNANPVRHHRPADQIARLGLDRPQTMLSRISAPSWETDGLITPSLITRI